MSEGKAWNHGVFGCFDNCGLCVMAYFCPCVVFGKTMEAMGESCMLCGACFFVQAVGIAASVYRRNKLREMEGIEGSLTMDIFWTLCCGQCALVQEAQQLKDMGKYGAEQNQAVARE